MDQRYIFCMYHSPKSERSLSLEICKFCLHSSPPAQDKSFSLYKWEMGDFPPRKFRRPPIFHSRYGCLPPVSSHYHLLTPPPPLADPATRISALLAQDYFWLLAIIRQLKMADWRSASPTTWPVHRLLLSRRPLGRLGYLLSFLSHAKV
jgi:hypothetical protein